MMNYPKTFVGLMLGPFRRGDVHNSVLPGVDHRLSLIDLFFASLKPGFPIGVCSLYFLLFFQLLGCFPRFTDERDFVAALIKHELISREIPFKILDMMLKLVIFKYHEAYFKKI